MLLALTPGVIFTQEQFGASGFSGTRGWDVNSSYKFNGARAGNGNNVFMLNGTLISDNGSQWDFAPSVDAIQEFSAMTTIYDAQYGHEAGGVVNTVIKGGTQLLARHGLRLLPQRGSRRQQLRQQPCRRPEGPPQQNQFGGTFGGPIRKDKDFVFASFEGWQEVIPFPGAGVTGGAARPARRAELLQLQHDHLRSVDHAPLRRRAHRALQRHQRFHLLARSVPGQRDPAEPHQPHRHQDPLLPAGAEHARTGRCNGFPGITSNYINPTNRAATGTTSPSSGGITTSATSDKFYMLFSENHGFEYPLHQHLPPAGGHGQHRQQPHLHRHQPG